MWQPHRHRQRWVKGASGRNVSDLHTASRSFCAYVCVPASMAAASQTVNRSAKCAESASKALWTNLFWMSQCHGFNNLKEKNYAFFFKMRESVLLFVCYFLLVTMGPGDLLQRPSLFSCVLSSLEHSAYFPYLLQTVPYLACSHTSLLISSFHPCCDPTRAFLRACVCARRSGPVCSLR